MTEWEANPTTGDLKLTRDTSEMVTEDIPGVVPQAPQSEADTRLFEIARILDLWRSHHTSSGIALDRIAELSTRRVR